MKHFNKEREREVGAYKTSAPCRTPASGLSRSLLLVAREKRTCIARTRMGARAHTTHTHTHEPESERERRKGDGVSHERVSFNFPVTTDSQSGTHK